MSEPTKTNVSKTVSMPAEMFRDADLLVQADPELDWSKYVRRLIRQDLEKAKAQAPAVPQEQAA